MTVSIKYSFTFTLLSFQFKHFKSGTVDWLGKYRALGLSCMTQISKNFEVEFYQPTNTKYAHIDYT